MIGKPQFLRLPDGTYKSIHYWRDILEGCVDFVLQVNPSVPVPLKDKAGKKVNLLSDVKYAKKVAMKTTSYAGKTIYIFLNYDSSNCIANAIHILQHLPKGQVWQDVEVA